MSPASYETAAIVYKGSKAEFKLSSIDKGLEPVS